MSVEKTWICDLCGAVLPEDDHAFVSVSTGDDCRDFQYCDEDGRSSCVSKVLATLMSLEPGSPANLDLIPVASEQEIWTLKRERDRQVAAGPRGIGHLGLPFGIYHLLVDAGVITLEDLMDRHRRGVLGEIYEIGPVRASVIAAALERQGATA